METTQVATRMGPCEGALPELEIPMINTTVTCLSSEHRKFGYLIAQLAFAATKLADDPYSVTANQRAFEVWEELRRDLWSHLQIEDGLVFLWGEAHHVMSGTLLGSLKNERHEMRRLIAALRTSPWGLDSQLQTAGNGSDFAQTLLALALTLDAHVGRYDSEVLPSILRELPNVQATGA